MPLPTCPEGYIRCPYEEAHCILESRIQFHLVKCKKVHPESRMAECPFNTTHKVPEIELNCHKNYLCPDRRKIDTFICSTVDSIPLFPVQSYEVTSSEDWDDVQVETYNPMEHCKAMPILMNLQGATPSDRKNFRAEERHRYRSVVGLTAQPQTDNIEEKAPTRLPQTTPRSQFNNGAASKIPEELSRGRGRGRILK